MTTSRLDQVYRISSEEAQVKKLQNRYTPEQLAYEPLSPAVKEQAAISTIAPSTAKKDHPTLRPQLPLPAPEFQNYDATLKSAAFQFREHALMLGAATETVRYDPALKFAISQGLGNVVETLEEMVETIPADIDSEECEPERLHYLRIIIALHNTIEILSAKHLDFISKIIRQDSAELDRLHVKKTEELQKYAEKVKNEDTWSFFGTIAEYLTYAFSIVTGTALIATGVGAVAGSFLIAAGGLGLANRVMSDTGAWKNIVAYFTKSREMQEKIGRWISDSLFFVSMGLGLIGGVAALQSGGIRLIDAALGVEGAIEKLGVIGTVATAGINVGKEWSRKEMMETMSALKIIEGKLFLMQQILQQNGSEAKKTIETMQTLTKQTKEAISAFG